jgi:hypothetical protein
MKGGKTGLSSSKGQIRINENHEIENPTMNLLSRLMNNSASEQEAFDNLRTLFTELVKETISKYKSNDDYLHRIEEILNTIMKVRDDFMDLHIDHLKRFKNFNKWLINFDVLNLTNDVVYDFQEDAIARHRDLATGIYNTFTENDEMINSSSINGTKFSWMK